MRLAALALVLLVSGCGGQAAINSVVLHNNTVYISTNSVQAAKRICEGMGADFSRQIGRHAANLANGQPFPRYSLSRAGCYFGPTIAPLQADVHVIVCPAGDEACIKHEERHRSEGVFHN